MNCLICRRAELVERETSIAFERAEMKYVVHRVPARVCPACGDAYVDEDVAVKLLQAMDDISATGIMEDVLEYESL